MVVSAISIRVFSPSTGLKSPLPTTNPLSESLYIAILRPAFLSDPKNIPIVVAVPLAPVYFEPTYLSPVVA